MSDEQRAPSLLPLLPRGLYGNLRSSAFALYKSPVLPLPLPVPPPLSPPLSPPLLHLLTSHTIHQNFYFDKLELQPCLGNEHLQEPWYKQPGESKTAKHSS
jgi:hypothetical protein